jgi:ABC-type multidrug transport system permease subunit
MGFISGCFVASVVSITVFMSAIAGGAVVFLGVVPGRSPLALLAVIVCGSTFSAALGTMVGSVIRDERFAAGLSSTAVPVLILLGGGYFPIPERGPLSVVSPFTPYRWVYDALRSLFQGEGGGTRWEIVLLCVPVAALLLVLSSVVTHRRWR